MANLNASLEFYGAQTGFAIHVIDSDPSAILTSYDDLSQVEKYEISETDYNNRDDSFRKFKQKMMQ